MIALATPRYYTQEIDKPVNIFVQLVRPSSNDCGNSVILQLLPHSSLINNTSDAEIEQSLKRKRSDFKSVDILNHPSRLPCGCILTPIINPDCPIHNVPKKLNLVPGPMTNNNMPRPKLFYFNQQIADGMAPVKRMRYGLDM